LYSTPSLYPLSTREKEFIERLLEVMRDGKVFRSVLLPDRLVRREKGGKTKPSV
jgi:nucleoside diphosphate kinase